MGSAFYCEPRYGIAPEEFVTFLTFPSDDQTDLICHLPHAECAIQEPHRMSECGRFERAADASQEPK